MSEGYPGQGHQITVTLERLGYSRVSVAPSAQAAVEAAKIVGHNTALIYPKLLGATDGFAAADRLLQECSLPAIFLAGHHSTCL